MENPEEEAEHMVTYPRSCDSISDSRILGIYVQTIDNDN